MPASDVVPGYDGQQSPPTEPPLMPPRVGDADGTNPCAPRLSANPWVLDIVLTTLVAQAIVVVYAAASWFKKPGGLVGDPTTIAGVAAVMGHPEVDALFAGMPGEMNRAELRQRLRGRRFRLGTYMLA